MEPVRIKRRAYEPATTIVTWYRPDEDHPATTGAVLDDYGRQIYYRDYKWLAVGTDGGYYEATPPEYWCYIPRPPRNR